MGWSVVRNLPQTHTHLETPEKFLARYSGTKRLRYQKAIEQNAMLGLPPWTGKLTMFVKNESINPRKKTNPDPRAIQFRDANFSAELALFLKPIEHEIYRTVLRGKYYGVGRVIGKGLNMRQRAQLIKRKMNNFHDCAVVSIDAKRFDLHVSEELLKMEHAYYIKFNSDPEFARLLRMQLHNFASTRSGWAYDLKGGRMSGDMNTGLGNCVISLIMFKALVNKLKVKMDLLVDGDDALLFIERRDLSRLSQVLVPHYLEFGMEMEVADIAFTMEDVDWCQTRPIYVDGHYTMVRNPVRTLSHVLVSKKWQPHRQRDYMASIALCEQSLNRGVPVLQAMSRALWRNSSQNANALDSERREALFSRVLAFSSWETIVKEGFKEVPVSQASRLSFERAFNISVSEQVAWEHYLDQWVCKFGVAQRVDDYWDQRTWSATPHAPLGFYNDQL